MVGTLPRKQKTDLMYNMGVDYIIFLVGRDIHFVNKVNIVRFIVEILHTSITV